MGGAQFKFYNKIEKVRRYRVFPYNPCPDTGISYSITNITHQNSNFFFFAKIEALLTHHNHPKSIGYPSVSSWLYVLSCTFCWFNQIIMTSIHDYCIIQNSFTAIKILWDRIYILYYIISYHIILIIVYYINYFLRCIILYKLLSADQH